MDTLHHALRTILVDRIGWPFETATEITECAHIVAYEKGATIFHAGESTDLCYVSLSGEVKLYYGSATGQRMLVTILRGGLLGVTDLGAEDSCGSPAGQLFSAQALSRCQVAIIARGRLVRALRDVSGPQLLRIVQSSSEQWTRLCSRFLEFLTMNVRDRLAYAITEIADTFGINDARGKLIALKLSHEDFAELVGASRPMVSKHLKELAQAGIFPKVNGRYIVTRDVVTVAVPRSSPMVRDDEPKRLVAVPSIVMHRAGPHRGKSRQPAAGTLRRAAE
ncbi:MAG: Crp/Fnr family transcriptional regulator [Candidatus Binatia bacterium]